jgi:hypothetical protein
MDRYRILSLDGGGSWALIQVKALIELFGPDKPGREILQDFDLVAANSGGSILQRHPMPSRSTRCSSPLKLSTHRPGYRTTSTGPAPFFPAPRNERLALNKGQPSMLCEVATKPGELRIAMIATTDQIIRRH